MIAENIKNQFKAIQEQRAQSVNEILDSNSLKKLIVAGPGTGKTCLFKQLAAKVDGKTLAITFINNLADDLRVELSGLADSRTFHSFCKGFLHRTQLTGITSSFRYFPKLRQIIESDQLVLNESSANMDEPFQLLCEDDGRIEFYLNRANYYDAVSHNDVVYRMIQILRTDSSRIPSYDLILVDEYQDFNLLEVELIDILATQNSIVIVGDDDQALYAFKQASPRFLRLKYNESVYAKFPLPFCSRCPDPIVRATKQIIHKATEAGLLKNRIDKPFQCFLPAKYQDGIDNPRVLKVKCSVHSNKAPYMSQYIVRTITDTVANGYTPACSDNIYDFLIAGKIDLLKNAYDCLSTAGFSSIEYKAKTDNTISYYDCFAELLDQQDSQIGWRSLLELESNKAKEVVLRQSVDLKTPISVLMPGVAKEYHKKTLEILNKIKSNQETNVTEEKWLEDVFMDPVAEIMRKLFRGRSASDETESAPSSVKIIVTTFMGCKGLSADHVFLVGLNNGVLPDNPSRPSDNEICQLLVGMTRARKRCHLIYAGRIRGTWHNPSIFLDWIDNGLVENVEVDKNFFM